MTSDSFAAFYARYYRLLLTVAEQRIGGVFDAEDATAEVFRIAWQRDCDGEELTLPWLYQTLRNVIGNEYRRISRANDFLRTEGPFYVGQTTMPADDEALTVRAALRRLPEADREILYMAHWEDLTREEIATILGYSTTNVRVRIHRARARLKSVLEKMNRENEEADRGRD